MQRHQCRLASVSLSGQIMWQWVLGVHMCVEKWVERGQSCCHKAFFPTSCQHNQNNSLTPNKTKCRIQKPSFPPAVCLDPIPWSWAEKARGGFILVLLLLIFLEWKILTVRQKVQHISGTDGSEAFLMLLAWWEPKLMSGAIFPFSFFLPSFLSPPLLFNLVFTYHR